MRFNLKTILPVCVFLWGFLAAANPPVGDKAPIKDDDITITSQTMTLDSKHKTVEFLDDVTVSDQLLTITCEKLICRMDDKDALYSIIAVGNVVVRTKKDWHRKIEAKFEGQYEIKAGRAVYKLRENLITLTVEPVMLEGKNEIKARTIELDLKTENFKIDEPRGVFYWQPARSQDGPKEKKQEDVDKNDD